MHVIVRLNNSPFHQFLIVKSPILVCCHIRSISPFTIMVQSSFWSLHHHDSPRNHQNFTSFHTKSLVVQFQHHIDSMSSVPHGGTICTSCRWVPWNSSLSVRWKRILCPGSRSSCWMAPGGSDGAGNARRFVTMYDTSINIYICTL